MSLPEGILTVTLTGHIARPDGANSPDFVRVTPAAGELVSSQYGVILRGTVPAVPGDSGAWSLVLPANDDPTLQPSGGTYRIDRPGRSYYVQLLHSMGTVDLAALTPVPEDDGEYVLTPGPPGTAGENGQDGEDGQDGASAYQVAVANGFVGTEVQWLASLKGPKGDPGDGEGGGGPGISSDGHINQEIITLAPAAAWTIVTTSGGVEIGNTIKAAVGQRVRFSPSFLRTGGVVFLDIGIKAAAGGVSRYVSSGTSTPREEGYAPLYPLSQFVGVVGIREFIVQEGEVDGSGNVKIVIAYKGAADGGQRLYWGAGYDGAVWLENPDQQAS